MKRLTILMTLILAALAARAPAAAPATGPAPVEVAPYTGEGPILVVTTTGMLADLAREIGGERVSVQPLMGEGTDPHLYKASPGDVRLLRGADLILHNGLHLEGKMAEILEKLADRQPVFAVCERIDPDRLIEVGEGVHDPHLWFDVLLWRDVAAEVGAILAAFDPAHAEAHAGRLADLRERMEALHRAVASAVEAIPPGRRILITSHDAFGYLGRAYGLEVLGIQGLSTESEAGVRRINELVERIVAAGLPAVFVETSVSDKNMMALLEGCRARGHEVRIGGALFSDAMGAAGTPEATYAGMIRHNTRTLLAALAGEAAARAWAAEHAP